MCGILGNLNRSKYIEDTDINNFFRFGECLKCRGPDNFNYFIDNNKKNYLAHYRLSILDLSKNSNQPIFSEDKRYVMSFNGEIYNFKYLSSKIEKFKNKIINSDTRVLIEYISTYGIEKAINDINGMFAISLLDQKTNYLYLARDHFGKKPIYYSYKDQNFFFSSTLKPLMLNRNIEKKIDQKSLNNFFKYGFCSDNHSIFENIHKLPANSILSLNLNNWAMDISQVKSFKKEDLHKEKFSTEKLENIIYESVENRMITDVPICLLLSSGVDSSLVSYFASRIDNKIQTFTVGFKDKFYDESENSKKIANYFGLKNETIFFNEKDLIDTINSIPDAFDEPFADSSQLPTMLIFQKISQHAKVAITGDGGDEIFYGYNRYQWFLIWKKFFKNNFLANKRTKNILSYLIEKSEKNFFGKKIYNHFNITTNKTQKFLNIFFNKSNIYQEFLKLSYSENFLKNNIISQNKDLNNVEDLRNFDINNYLVDDILTKVDRSSMYYSVEARSPLLDKNIYLYLKNISSNKHINLFNKKILLKKILNKKLPKKINSKFKKGFSVPIDKILFSYFEKEIINCFNELKKDERLNFLNISKFEEIIYGFFNNKDYKLSYQIWSFYVFFKWFNKYKKYINS